jgi:hypothetical protein
MMASKEKSQPTVSTSVRLCVGVGRYSLPAIEEPLATPQVKPRAQICRVVSWVADHLTVFKFVPVHTLIDSQSSFLARLTFWRRRGGGIAPPKHKDWQITLAPLY